MEKSNTEKLVEFLTKHGIEFSIDNNPSPDKIRYIYGELVKKPILNDEDHDQALKLYQKLRLLSKEDEKLKPLKKEQFNKIYAYENNDLSVHLFGQQ